MHFNAFSYEGIAQNMIHQEIAESIKNSAGLMKHHFIAMF